jgi:hypothetical protein
MNNKAIAVAALKSHRDELLAQVDNLNKAISTLGGERKRVRKPKPAVAVAKTNGVDRGAAARKAWATKKAKAAASKKAQPKAASLAEAAAD